MLEFGTGAVVGALLGSGATISVVVGGTDGLGVRLRGMDHKPFDVLRPLMII